MNKPERKDTKKALDDPYYKGAPNLDLISEFPSPDRNKPLPLNEVHDKDFENICVAILEAEPDISRANLKRKDGVKQFGVDAEGFADEEADFDIDVVSAKCYKKIIPSHLKTWGDDFLNHLVGHWKGKKVRRFVLAVTVELTGDNLNKKIEQERKRFRKKDIKYEIWGLHQLEKKLRGQREVIERYFHSGWADRVCGASTSAYSLETGYLHFQENKRLKNELNSERLKILKDELGKHNAGHLSKFGDAIDAIRDDQSLWSSLGNEDMAYVLRADIIRALDEGDITHAKKLYDQCKPLLSPDADKDLPAYIAYMKGDRAEALNILATPASIREKTMRCSLLIEVGQIELALDELKAIQDEDGKSAEVGRIQAIAYAQLGKDEEALEALHRAERHAPANCIVKWTGAIIRYLLALSPAMPRKLTTYPQPIPRDLVREDSNAIALLDKATSSFQSLRNEAEPGLAAQAGIWKLATLSNHSSHSDEAEKLAAELLSKTNPHPLVVAWALTRGFPVNEKKILRSFENLLDDRKGSVNHLITVVNLLLQLNRNKKAGKLLDKHAKQFDDTGDKELLDRLKLLVSGKEVGVFTASIPNDKTIDEVIASLPDDERYGMALWEIAETLASANRWTEVFEIRDALTQKVQTARAFEMAASAAFNTGNFQEAMDILVNAKSSYPKQELPYRLRRMEIDAAKHSGNLSRANKLSQSLAQISDDITDKLKTIEIKLAIGDIKGGLTEFQKIENHHSIPPDKIIEYARRFRLEDRKFASELLQTLKEREIDDQFVTQIYELALDLGDKAISQIMHPRLAMIAAEDKDIDQPRAVSIPENKIIELLERQHQVAEQRRLLWLAGEQTAHLTFDNGAFSLGHLFWNCLDIRHSHDQWDPEYMLLLRSGGRLHPVELQTFGSSDLYLDISSLLLGYHMSILGKLEQAVSAIFVPQALPTALQQLEEELTPVQPHLKEADSAIHNAIENGSIKATQMDGEPIEYQYSFDPDEKQSVAKVISIAQIVSALESHGIIDSALKDSILLEQDDASKKLAVANQIALGNRILCDIPSLIDIFQSGFFDQATANFELLVNEQVALHFKHVSGMAKESLRAVAWIKKVREYVKDKLEKEEWKIIPAGAVDDFEFDVFSTPVKQCLAELVYLRTTDNALIWIEDRFVSGYGTNGRHLLVTLPDLLETLRTEKVISEQVYHEHRRQLRGYGYGFLPIQIDELLAALHKAPVRNNVAINTPRLLAIRRSLFEQIACTKYLVERGQEDSDGRANEFWFLSRQTNLAHNSIIALWNREDITHEQKFIWSDWIWKSLRIDRVEHIPVNNNTEENKRMFFIMHMAGLLSSTLAIDTENKGSDLVMNFAAIRKKRQEYLGWVLHRVIAPATSADVELISAIARQVSEALLLVFRDHRPQGHKKDEREDRMNKILFNEVLTAFPDEWRERLLDHPQILDFFRSVIGPTITLQKLNFEPSEFWNTVQRVLSGQSCTLPTRNGSEKIKLEAISTSNDDFQLKSTGALEAYLDDKSLLLASSSKQQWAEVLEKNPLWIDHEKSEQADIISTIVHEQDTIRRMNMLGEARADSVAYSLSELIRLIRINEVDHEALRPRSSKALRGFLRLPTNKMVAILDELDEGVRQLLEEFTPLEVLQRVGGLPVALPAFLLDRLTSTIEKDISTFRAELDKHSITPVVAAHLGRAINNSALSVTDKQTLALQLLADAHETHGELFLSILGWSFRNIDNAPEWIAVSEDERELLAWIHANNLLTILIDEGVEPEQAQKIFDTSSERPLIRGMRFRNRTRRALSSMRQLMPSRLLYDSLTHSGIAYENIERGSDIAMRLRSLLGIQQNDQWISGVFTMIRPKKEKPKTCWIGEGKPEYLLHLVGSDQPAPFVIGSDAECVDAILKEIEKSPNVPMTWIHLAAFGLENMTDDQQARALQICNEVPTKELLEKDVDFGHLEVMLSVYGALANEVDGKTDLFTSRLKELVSSFAKKNPKLTVSADLTTKNRATDLLVAVVSAILRTGLVCHDDVKESIDFFTARIRKISEIWPGSIEGLIALLDRISRETPFDCMENMSILSNELRGVGSIR